MIRPTTFASPWPSDNAATFVFLEWSKLDGLGIQNRKSDASQRQLRIVNVDIERDVALLQNHRDVTASERLLL